MINTFRLRGAETNWQCSRERNEKKEREEIEEKDDTKETVSHGALLFKSVTNTLVLATSAPTDS